MVEPSPPFEIIKTELEAGRVVPFLGAGASLVGRPEGATWRREEQPPFLPRGDELAAHLARAYEFPGDSHDLLAVAQYCDEAGGREPLKRWLYRVFASAAYPLGQLHRYLASIERPLIVLTTNYDDLLERAFSGRAYHLLVHRTDVDEDGEQILWRPPGESSFQRVLPKYVDFDATKETVIYKMHGSVVYDADEANQEEREKEQLEGQYVITEDDYVDFLTRLTKGKALPANLADPLENRHFLFLGYALRDWSFRVVLNRVQTPARREKKIVSWAIDAAPSPIEQAFWLARGVRIYRLPIEELVRKLQHA
jgi:hypothetical protein